MDTADETIHPWSRDKLELLGKYLKAYSRIMQSQKAKWLRSYSYIDAFASVGAFLDPDSQAYVDGSPFVALRCEPGFDEFWFIEMKASRLDSLRRRVEAEYSGHQVYYRQGDANTVLRNEIARRITRENRRRGFIFLDPYGLEVDFETVRCLSRSEAFDIFINLSTMGVTRLCPRGELPDEQTIALLNRVMGDASWVDDIYVRQEDLFGGEQSYRGRLDPLQVARHYIENLRPLFPYISEPILMRNSREAPLYVLLLASHNHRAVRITNDIIGRYERLRAQQ